MSKFADFSLPRKAALVAFLIASVSILGGCASTVAIPESDTQPPQVQLLISGPVIGTQNMSNPPNENWAGPGGAQLFDLATGTEYGFTLTVSDEGGVARAHLSMPFEFAIAELNPAQAIEEIGFTRTATLLGSILEPRSALVISGRFRTPELDGEILSFEFIAEGADFGGSLGRNNVRTMRVNAVARQFEE